MQQSIQLVQGVGDQFVEAILLDLAQKHLDDFNTLWREQLRQYQQEDKYWDWVFKKRISLSKDNYEGYAIEYEGRTQGLMAIETQQHCSQLDRRQRLVYVQALATAPWNRRAIRRPPELRGVGTALLLLARQRSVDLGYRGRVGLHSLSGAEEFYESKNMLRFAPNPDDYSDPDDEPLTYFEYPPLRSLR